MRVYVPSSHLHICRSEEVVARYQQVKSAEGIQSDENFKKLLNRFTAGKEFPWSAVLIILPILLLKLLSSAAVRHRRGQGKDKNLVLPAALSLRPQLLLYLVGSKQQSLRPALKWIGLC
ncbi:hypothetical protein PENFLA_c016G07461 [Penicillium flavigenum]|uniref:Uncharacterized protein n=1 Tax=Penicillium flavigenum TaxID=254877 RepID=A0A1V6T492_9EURO|nr:hypothetical protein PENFLA_c016G07461 [Penicillium flavigenum]